MKDEGRAALVTARVALVFAVIGTAVAVGNSVGILGQRPTLVDDYIIIRDRDTGAIMQLGRFDAGGFGIAIWDRDRRSTRLLTQLAPDGSIENQMSDSSGTARLMTTVDKDQHAIWSIVAPDGSGIQTAADADGKIKQWWIQISGDKRYGYYTYSGEDGEIHRARKVEDLTPPDDEGRAGSDDEQPAASGEPDLDEAPKADTRPSKE